MTPIARALASRLPRPLVVPALALIYAAMILAVVLLGIGDHPDIMYIDINRP